MINIITITILIISVVTIPLNLYIERETDINKPNNTWEITPDYLHLYLSKNTSTSSKKIIYKSPIKFSKDEFLKISLCKPSSINMLNPSNTNIQNFLTQNCLEDLNKNLITINLDEKMPLFDKNFNGNFNLCSFGMLIAESERSLRRISEIDSRELYDDSSYFVRTFGDMVRNYQMGQKMKYRSEAIMSGDGMCRLNFGVESLDYGKFSDVVRYVEGKQGGFSYLFIGYEFEGNEVNGVNDGFNYLKREVGIENSLKEFHKKRAKFFDKKIYNFPDKNRITEKIVNFNIGVYFKGNELQFSYEGVEQFECSQNSSYSIGNLDTSQLQEYSLVPLLCFKSFETNNITHDEFRKSRCQTLTPQNLPISQMEPEQKIGVQAVILNWYIENVPKKNKNDKNNLPKNFLKIDYCGINPNCDHILDNSTKSLFYICYFNYKIKEGNQYTKNISSNNNINLDLNININDSLINRRILGSLSEVEFFGKKYQLPGCIVKIRKFGRFCDENPIFGVFAHILLIALYVAFLGIMCAAVWTGTILYFVFSCITMPISSVYHSIKGKRRILTQEIKNLADLLKIQNRLDKKSLLTYKFFEKNKIKGNMAITTTKKIKELKNYKITNGISDLLNQNNLSKINYKQEIAKEETEQEIDNEIKTDLNQIKENFQNFEDTDEGDLNIKINIMNNNMNHNILNRKKSYDLSDDDINEEVTMNKVKVFKGLDNSFLFQNSNSSNVFLNMVDYILDNGYAGGEYRRRRRIII